MNLKPWFVKLSTLVLTIILSLTIFSLPASAFDEDALLRLEDRNECSGCDLSEAPLNDKNLSEANLKNANLCNAILDNADLTNANLEGAELNDATLINANLSGIDTNLKNAFLVGANLSGADISEANMQGANLKNATLRETNLCNTFLFEATMPDDTIYDSGITVLERNCPQIKSDPDDCSDF